MKEVSPQVAKDRYDHLWEVINLRERASSIYGWEEKPRNEVYTYLPSNLPEEDYRGRYFSQMVIGDLSVPSSSLYGSVFYNCLDLGGSLSKEAVVINELDFRSDEFKFLRIFGSNGYLKNAKLSLEYTQSINLSTYMSKPDLATFGLNISLDECDLISVDIKDASILSLFITQSLLKDCSFTNCGFERIFLREDVEFLNIRFENCIFEKAGIAYSTMDRCFFHNCIFAEYSEALDIRDTILNVEVTSWENEPTDNTLSECHIYNPILDKIRPINQDDIDRLNASSAFQYKLV